MMDPYTRRFIKASLVWLCVGVVIGLVMAVRPQLTVNRPAHLHALLLGIVAMMIFGVAYHVIPRFGGRALIYPRLATAHLIAANVGLAAMVCGFVARVSGEQSLLTGAVLLGVGGSLSSAGAVAFAVNIWRTMDAARVPLRRGLPLAEQ
jgi:cytochrome c oxidase cbb3-type subunit 1